MCIRDRPEGVDAPDGAGFDPPARYDRVVEGDRLVPSAQDYATVGHLYRGIRAGLEELARTYGEKQLFVGDPAAQVGKDMAPLDELCAVTDLASALQAVDTIVEQGEGSPNNPEKSHYRRFVAVRDELRATLAARPDFEPAHPVARNPVMRKPPLPQGKVHIETDAAPCCVKPTVERCIVNVRPAVVPGCAAFAGKRARSCMIGARSCIAVRELWTSARRETTGSSASPNARARQRSANA